MNRIIILIAFGVGLYGPYGFSQVTEDTITFEIMIPTDLEAYGCNEYFGWAFPVDVASQYHQVTNLRMIIEGQTFGDVRPDDIEVQIECVTTGQSAQRSIDHPGPTGTFLEFETDITVANGLYPPNGLLEFKIYARRNYSNSPANPNCGTEEAFISRWLIIIENWVDDLDMDGYRVGEDCGDTNTMIHPDAIEVCDGLDNNCNEAIDEGVSCTNVFIGTGSDWFIPSNWSLGIIPNGKHQVFIPNGKTVTAQATSPFSIIVLKSLILESGGTLTLQGENLFLYYSDIMEIEQGALLDIQPKTSIIAGTPS